MELKEWVHTPYHGKQYADSTLRGMKKEELIQIIRDYEHNFNALYEANERGIQAATKMLAETDKAAEWQYKTMSVPGGKGQTYAKWSCSACKGKQVHRSRYCPNCGNRMKDGVQDDV